MSALQNIQIAQFLNTKSTCSKNEMLKKFLLPVLLQTNTELSINNFLQSALVQNPAIVPEQLPNQVNTSVTTSQPGKCLSFSSIYLNFSINFY